MHQITVRTVLAIVSGCTLVDILSVHLLLCTLLPVCPLAVSVPPRCQCAFRLSVCMSLFVCLLVVNVPTR